MALMKMCVKYLIVVCLALSLTEATPAPFVTKCKWDDSKCIKETSQKIIPLFADGIPELNVEQLDPMIIKHIDASTSNLKLIVTDAKVTGLKGCEAKKVTRDIEKSKLFVKVLCTCDLEAKYDMKGQLFVLPIEGNGDLRAKIRKVSISVDADMSDKVKDGKKYWTVKSWKHSYELKDTSDVKFENLFPDNEFLRTTTDDLISKNGNDVVTEIGQPVIKAVVAKVIANIQHFFLAVPVEDLALS